MNLKTYQKRGLTVIGIIFYIIILAIVGIKLLPDTAEPLLRAVAGLIFGAAVIMMIDLIVTVIMAILYWINEEEK